MREVRSEAGWSQAELAARLGTTQSAVSRWERGGDEPRLSTLTAIVAACGFRLRVVVERDDATTPVRLIHAGDGYVDDDPFIPSVDQRKPEAPGVLGSIDGGKKVQK